MLKISYLMGILFKKSSKYPDKEIFFTIFFCMIRGILCKCFFKISNRGPIFPKREGTYFSSEKYWAQKHFILKE